MKSIVESNFTSGLDKGAFENVELSTLLDTGLKLILNTDMSNLFEQSVFECLKICTYDGKKSLNNYLMICLRQGKIITKSYQNVVRKTYALFQEPRFRVSSPYEQAGTKPKVSITAEYEEVIANTLAKAGWYSGNPHIIFILLLIKY